MNFKEAIGLSKSEINLKTELRHLPIKDRIQLSSILDVNHNWKQLAAIIPEPDGVDGYLMSSHNITVLEDLLKIGKSPTQALFDYWGTSGRKRATIEDLIQLLNSCHLYRASLYLSKDLLQIQCFDTNCDNYESIDQRISDLNLNFNDNNSCDHKWTDLSTKLLTDCCGQSNDNRNNGNFLDPSAPNESQISFSTFGENNRHLLGNEEFINYSYNAISCATNQFSEIVVSKGGHKLGEGAFGTVFRCRLTPQSDFIAVKKLKNDFQKQFTSELTVLSRFRHQNLLSLRGISSDGPSLLIIYDYMSNGSLQDYLENNAQSLLWPQRLAIALGTAKGICYLHESEDKPYIHRDIKSANILLDDKLNPRVGDFGLVRIGSSGANTGTQALATTIFGTSIYMAPEAFRGDISVKLDSFSFGIVLLELLTGLKPYDENRDGFDLLSNVEELTTDLDEEDNTSVVNSIIDRRPDGQSGEKIGLELYRISRKCTEQRKKYRPTVTEVLKSLQEIEFTFES